MVGCAPTSTETDSLGLLLDVYVWSSKATKPVLPSASSILLKGGASSGQVFNNPYKKAEIEQIASLEKHVKMVTSIHLYAYTSTIRPSAGFNIHLSGS